MEIICVPAIVSITYGLIEMYKKFIAKERETWLKIIPLIALIIGGVLGVALFFIAPTLIVAESVWVALIVGFASGLSAVGSNQVFKQFKKLGIEVKEQEQSKNE